MLRITCLLLVLACVMPAVADSAPFGNKVCLRGNLDNARLAFERTGKGTVAFLGGSITEMNGYRPMVCEILKKRFPKTEFTFVNAGISSTCSTTGAFRFKTDVLDKGPVDLLLVEFAVNDDQDGHHTRAECIRGMEGVVRHLRQASPETDVAMIFFVNESILKTAQEGRTPLTAEAHAAVAERYGVPTVNLAQEVADEITAGKLTWTQYGGVHPAPFGNAICARMIDELFSRAWREPLPGAAAAVPHPMPSAVDPLCYCNGRFIALTEAKVKSGWKLGVPDWKKLPGAKRDRFTSVPVLEATGPGAELTLAFDGTAVGAFIVAGPDAGVAEASVDGAPFKSINLYRDYSKGLHYPYTVMLGTDLPSRAHVLTLRMSAETRSAGRAMRILQFTAN